MIVERITRLLEGAGVPYALIGGRAVAVRGHLRSTIDYDFLAVGGELLGLSMWKDLIESGVAVDIRKGESDDPLVGVIRIAAEPEHADVIVARWNWELEVIRRAEVVEYQGLLLPVPRRSDLILLKLAAGGPLDLQDAWYLMQFDDREEVIGEVDRNIGALQPDAREKW